MASSVSASASASAIDDDSERARAKARAEAYLLADINSNSVVPVHDARANRSAVYKPYKSKIIGDLKFFINWIKNGARVAVIGLRQAVEYKWDGQKYYTESINKDGTYNLTKGGQENMKNIVKINIPYEDLILHDSHFVRGSLSINALQIYLEKLKLDVKNIQSIFLKLHLEKSKLRTNFTVKSQTTIIGDKTRFFKGNDWLKDQAIQIFDKIKELNRAKQELGYLRNRDTADTISDVEKILDELVEVLYLIIPIPEVVKYIMERERERKSEKQAVAHAPNSNIVYPSVIGNKRKNPLDAKEDERFNTRYKPAIPAGGKSMKPKQHQNSKTQKKRQRKNQKK